MIERFYTPLEHLLRSGKVLVLYGPRRAGKTTLLQNFLQGKTSYRFDSGDNIRIQDVLGSRDFTRLLEYAEGVDLLVIDEAQQIPEIGMGLKILVDQKPEISIIATGSSSFDLANSIGEPLTGRKRTVTLYPIAQMELAKTMNHFDLKERLSEFLVFGSYPEVVTAKSAAEKTRLLEELVDSYILKDILALERVKGSRVLLDLLKLLAFQVGSEVSLNELAVQLHLNIKTVDRYLDLLEKTFVIVRVGGYSRNLRKEIRSKQKYYFLDNGVRNAIISQFQPIGTRNDIGQLWENFVFVERLKKRSYKEIHANHYFWRTYDGQEVDLVEERDGKLFGYEMKWSERKEKKPPKDWLATYPNAEYKVINPQNYLDFVA